jgi:hypothetical protein
VKFAICTAAGQILRTLSCPQDQVAPNVGTGEQAIEIPDGVGDDTHYFDGTDFVPMPAKAHDYQRFDFATKTWVDPRTLLQVKSTKRNELKSAALAAATADLTVSTVTFSVSLDIKAELAQELALAQAEGASYSLEWERADGTPITLTGAQVRGLLRAMSTRAANIRSTLRTKIAAVNAATTIAEVEAIEW